MEYEVGKEDSRDVAYKMEDKVRHNGRRREEERGSGTEEEML